MSRKWLILIGLFCLVQPSGTFAADTIDAVKLREYCQLVGLDDSQMNDEKILHASICLFYVAGISEGYGVSGVKPKEICYPEDSMVTNGQKALIVSKYLNDHPDMLNNPSYFLVLDALSKAFPCSAPSHRK
jgi:hypothetical protein